MQHIRAYFPSARFSVLAVAIAISAAVIWFAISLTTPHDTARIESSGSSIADNSDWQTAFASSTAFQDAQDLNAQATQLIQAASSSNLTESLGRAILISAAAARGQGLGDDTMTQNRIIGGALSQINSTAVQPSTVYAASDITIAPSSDGALHTFGNTLASTIESHTLANDLRALTTIGLAVDNSDPSILASFNPIASDYRALAKDVAAVPTPQTLAPTIAQLANNYTAMATECADMRTVLSDPVRGLSGLQAFNDLSMQNARLLATIAETFKNNGILYTVSEPGTAWSAFLLAEQKAALQAAQQLQSSSQQNNQSNSN